MLPGMSVELAEAGGNACTWLLPGAVDGSRVGGNTPVTVGSTDRDKPGPPDTCKLSGRLVRSLFSLDKATSDLTSSISLPCEKSGKISLVWILERDPGSTWEGHSLTSKGLPEMYL